jgi:hypothetical protein
VSTDHNIACIARHINRLAKVGICGFFVVRGSKLLHHAPIGIHTCMFVMSAKSRCGVTLALSSCSEATDNSKALIQCGLIAMVYLGVFFSIRSIQCRVHMHELQLQLHLQLQLQLQLRDICGDICQAHQRDNSRYMLRDAGAHIHRCAIGGTTMQSNKLVRPNRHSIMTSAYCIGNRTVYIINSPAWHKRESLG